MSPTKADITIWRGNSKPIIWQADLDWSGSDAVLTVFDRYGQRLFTKRTDDGSLDLDLDLHRVTWTCSVDESRLIPLGGLCCYELERWIGPDLQATLAYGTVTGQGGLNVDV